MLVAMTTFALLSMHGTGAPIDHSIEAREGQWIHRPVLGDGTRQTTAVFLSWDYSTVIFTAKCDLGTKELVVRHRLDSDLQATDNPQIVLSSPKQSLPLKTAKKDDVLEGRARITDEWRALLAGASELQIDAPNEMGEPYHVGQAKPLRDLALACR